MKLTLRAALSISQLPFLGPIGAVRLGRVGGAFVVTPTYAEQAESDLELVVAGSRQALVMVEGGARVITTVGSPPPPSVS